MPSEANTSSKLAVNFASRRNDRACSARLPARLLAIWVTKKPVAKMPLAWAVRNRLQVGPPRGAGPIPRLRRIRRIELVETRTPSPRSSSRMRTQTQRRFSRPRRRVVSGSVGEPSEALGVPRSTMSLTRSSASSSRADAGVKVQQGTLDDLDILRSAASESDGVIHLAFKHVVAFSGDMDGALDANRRAIDTFGEALAGSDRPLVITSGVLGLAPGRLATEQEARDLEAAHRGGAAARMAAEQAVPAFTSGTWIAGSTT